MGDRFGEYERIERLGSGAMGSVWRAVHPRFGDVALKVLNPHAGPEARATLITEARAVARFDHPNVVRLFDVGEREVEGPSGGLVPFLAMERFVGTIGQPHGFDEVAAALAQVLDGLAHAHARGVVHRDVKPANVLVRADGTLAVADFGIAYALGGGGVAVAGSPAYMAPEQIRGRTEELGPWTDVYAVGCLAWALCTGAPPFGFLKVTQRHLSEPVPAFAPRFAMPSAFERWVRWLLLKNPLHRPRYAADARVELDALSTGRAAFVPAQVTRDEHGTISVTSLLDGGEEPSTGGTLDDPREAHDTRPVAPERVVWRAPTPAPGIGLLAIRTVPLVGHTAARDALWARLVAATRRHTQVVVVRGAAGVGKTTLLRWLAEEVAERGVAEPVWLTHPRRPGAGGAEDGIEGALRRWALPAVLPLAEARRRVQRLLDALPGLQDRDTDELIGWLVPGGEPVPAEVRLDLARRVLVARARHERPLLVLIDDAGPGQEAVELAARLCRSEAAALIVVSHRPEAFATDPRGDAVIAELVGLVGGEAIELVALEREERRAVLAALAPLAPPVVDALCQAEPALAVQVVRDLVVRKQLADAPDGLGLVDGAVVDVPRDRRDVWARRLAAEAMSPEDRAVVERAAALGSSFSLAKLRAVDPAGVVPPLVARLVVDEVWVAARDRVVWDEAARDAVIDAAIAAGTWTAACSAAIAVEDDPAMRGLLLLACGRSAEAYPLLLEALKACIVLGSFGAADRYIEPAFAAAGADGDVGVDERRAKVLCETFGVMSLRQGRRAESAAVAERAVEYAERSGNVEVLCLALLSRCEALRSQNQIEACVATAERAHALASSDQVTIRTRARAWRALGIVYMLRGEFDRARVHHRDALNAAVLPRDRAWSHAQLGLLEAQVSRFDEARVHLNLAMQLAQEAHLISLETFLRPALGDVERQCGALELAEAHYRAALETYWLSRDARATEARMYLALVWLRAGRLAAAITALEAVIVALSDERRNLTLPYARLFLAEARALAGDVPGARAAYDQGIAEPISPDLDAADAFAGVFRAVAASGDAAQAAWAEDARRRAIAMYRSVHRDDRAAALEREA